MICHLIVSNVLGSMGSLSTTQFCYVIISIVYAMIAMPDAIEVSAVAIIMFLAICLSLFIGISIGYIPHSGMFCFMIRYKRCSRN